MSMNAIVKKVNGAINTQVRKATIELFSSVVKMTPVDTGRARGNWIPSVGEPVTTAIKKKAPVGTTVISEIVSVVPKGVGHVVWLSNNVPYIRKLEYNRPGEGGSAQAPEGMVRISIRRFGSILSGAIASKSGGDLL